MLSQVRETGGNASLAGPAVWAAALNCRLEPPNHSAFPAKPQTSMGETAASRLHSKERALQRFTKVRGSLEEVMLVAYFVDPWRAGVLELGGRLVWR